MGSSWKRRARHQAVAAAAQAHLLVHQPAHGTRRLFRKRVAQAVGVAEQARARRAGASPAPREVVEALELVADAAHAPQLVRVTSLEARVVSNMSRELNSGRTSWRNCRPSITWLLMKPAVGLSAECPALGCSVRRLVIRMTTILGANLAVGGTGYQHDHLWNCVLNATNWLDLGKLGGGVGLGRGTGRP